MTVIITPQRVIIENVRKVSWDTGEMCEFASCLVSALQALGEEVAYDSVMGDVRGSLPLYNCPGQMGVRQLQHPQHLARRLCPNPPRLRGCRV